MLRAQRKAEKDLRELAGSRWQEFGFVFPSSFGTRQVARNVGREYQALPAEAHIPGRRLLDLRHTTATFLLAAGVSERVVMEILGHSRIGLTMNSYAHVMPAVPGEATSRLSAFFPAAS